ncbi:MAG: MBL fold metallo-hydrolase [Ancalomicrobiaceae bacterium]|nr:MBL fold metallo-hydrolase [Ancalomicrobiaceae bacterium]
MLSKSTIQPPGLFHLGLGDIVVTAVNDGTYQADFDMIINVDPAECDRIERDAFRVVPPRMTMNAFLLQLGDRLAMIDTGWGGGQGPLMGMVPRNLAAMGVAPADIDTILLTHLHPDHMNGLIDAHGRAIYPRAELVINEAELNFFLDDSSPARAPEPARGFFAEAKAAIGPYRDRIRTVRDGAAALPGITVVTFPGHTPGHTAWNIESAGESVLIWGDIVHMPALQLAAPEAGTVLDVDPELGIKSRRRVLDMAANDKRRVAGIHMDFPTFGYIARSGTGYRFVPEAWKLMV